VALIYRNNGTLAKIFAAFFIVAAVPNLENRGAFLPSRVI
jgi:hypothetical protein